MTAASLAGVALGFPGRPLFTNLDLSLHQGEFVGLFGPNGAGKTTLMRAMLGLIRPSQGQITILGTRARRGHPAIGYLPQQRAETLPPIRGRDLLAASLHGAKWGPPHLTTADNQAIDQALHTVGATQLAARAITTLSGGERQRVLIAQALLGRPKLLLLDEPLSGLDPTHQQAVVALLRSLQQSLGITVLCSAHDLNVLLPAMDRVLYLGAGQAALGTPGEIVTAPILSRLYGSPIDVIRAENRVFVVPQMAPTP